MWDLPATRRMASIHVFGHVSKPWLFPRLYYLVHLRIVKVGHAQYVRTRATLAPHSSPHSHHDRFLLHYILFHPWPISSLQSRSVRGHPTGIGSQRSLEWVWWTRMTKFSELWNLCTDLSSTYNEHPCSWCLQSGHVWLNHLEVHHI